MLSCSLESQPETFISMFVNIMFKRNYEWKKRFEVSNKFYLKNKNHDYPDFIVNRVQKYGTIMRSVLIKG